MSWAREDGEWAASFRKGSLSLCLLAAEIIACTVPLRKWARLATAGTGFPAPLPESLHLCSVLSPSKSSECPWTGLSLSAFPMEGTLWSQTCTAAGAGGSFLLSLIGPVADQ